MIAIISLIYDSGTYGSKWFKILQMYGEKVVALYDPHRNSEFGGHHPPQHSNKLATMNFTLHIAFFAVAEGWLLLDIGWFVLFFYCIT